MARMRHPSRVSISVGNYTIDYECETMSFNKLRKRALQDMHDLLNNKNPLYYSDAEDDEVDDEPEREPSKPKKKVEVELMRSYA